MSAQYTISNENITFKERFAYGIGDFGSNLFLCIGTLYLLKFYTDELNIPAAYGGVIFLISKFFTAFTDILTGLILDSRKTIGPRGKFRPFILFVSFGNHSSVCSFNFYLRIQGNSCNFDLYVIWFML